MKDFSWKWVAFGLGYSLIIMNMLNEGLPAEYGGKPIAEVMRDFYSILMYGRGNFSVITALGILVFSAYPWLRKLDKGISTALVATLTFVFAVALSVVLGFPVLTSMLMVVVLLGILVRFVVGIYYAIGILVAPVALFCAYALPATWKIIKGAARNVRLVLTADN